MEANEVQLLSEAQQDVLLNMLLKLSTDEHKDGVTGKPLTRVYIGCDSVREKGTVNGKRAFFARYATVLIVHVDGSKGCRVFKHISRERDYDQVPGKPKLRMLNETAKSIMMYNQNWHLIDEFNPEIHLDINVNEVHGSSCAAKEAAGMVLGMTGLEAKLKSESWAASFGADGIVRGFHEREQQDAA